MTGISLADWQAAQQRILDLEAELSYARPVADAAWAYWSEFRAGREPVWADSPLGHLLAACDATTPSKTPATHVIVEVDELKRLREIAVGARGWANYDYDDTDLLHIVMTADGA